MREQQGCWSARLVPLRSLLVSTNIGSLTASDVLFEPQPHLGSSSCPVLTPTSLCFISEGQHIDIVGCQSNMRLDGAVRVLSEVGFDGVCVLLCSELRVCIATSASQ